MATEDYFIVAIELGSSKITGVAGKKLPDGSIQVLAMTQEDSTSFIRKGIIYNIDKTAQSLTSIVKKLQHTLKKSIGRVYVGIGGQGLHTVKNSVLRQLESETVISQELVDSILDSNLNTSISDRIILDVVPQEYKIGTQYQLDPVGVLSDHVEGRFLNVIARSAIHNNLSKCFAQAGIHVAEYILSPQVLAESVLTDAEKRSGCALVDIGADTTTVAVYKNNLLRHLAVIPLGSANVTKDIMSLQIEEDEAEELKLKYGSAYTEMTEAEEAKNYALKDGRTLTHKDLCDIIEARVEEILVNVSDQIRRSGFGKETLLAGMVLTGGGSNMKGLEHAVTTYTGFDKLKVVKNVLFSVRASSPDVTAKDGRRNTILGLLARGTVNCCDGEIKPIAPTLFEDEEEVDGPGHQTASGMTKVDELTQRQRELKEAEERAKQEEAERKAREEEEKRAAEERERRKEEKRRKHEEWKKNNIFTRFGRNVKKWSDKIVGEDE